MIIDEMGGDSSMQTEDGRRDGMASRVKSTSSPRGRLSRATAQEL